MINKIKEDFISGRISKSEFIDAMYLNHKLLFEYVELLKKVDIDSIDINKESVVFTTKEDNIKFISHRADKRTAPFEIMNFGNYESQDANLLYDLISDGDTIFDIGANIGWYSLVFAKKRISSIVHSFEPIIETYESLILNVKLNALKNIICNNFGFSNEARTTTFYTSLHTSVSNSAVNITDDIYAKEVICEVITLDSYAYQRGVKVDVIKCDVEGAELFVYEGGEKTIANNLPIVFTEMLRKWSAKFGYHPNDIILFFSRFGYNCFFVNSNLELQKIMSINNNTPNTNFFFLHPDKHASILNKYESKEH